MKLNALHDYDGVVPPYGARADRRQGGVRSVGVGMATPRSPDSAGHPRRAGE